ncbi:MAG: glycoside hydrolase [Acidimicrobiia bacterium]|nr:glycoside hydrolase [Acidimicrobiia bacterium]MDH4307068.1 glycoside hydrolase [Acidimicrobiia bacterium]MDH5292758.1 glycoside hydrolase [Acidimicrobiia bacterium]
MNGRRARIGTVLFLTVLALITASASAGAAGSTAISGLSPYPDGGDPTDPAAVTACNGEPQTGVLYRNSETEPYLAVNPTNPNNMIAGWHQDRWSNGAAQGLGAAFTVDGGMTWTPVNIPFTRCAGALSGSAGDYGRASDPWISFSPDGTAHYMALVADNTPNRNGMAVARSTDGGATWTEPQIIKANPARDPVGASLFHDKNSITADPIDPDLVYATWTLFRNGVTSLLVSRSTDGGEKWGPPIPIATFGTVNPAEVVSFRQGAQIVVLPDGTLVNAFYRILFDQKNLAVSFEQALFRSTDDGKHWDRMDIAVAGFTPAGAFDPELGIPVRDASQIPDIAVDDATGALYMTWQQANTQGLVEVAVSRSVDGGFTWSTPIRVSQEGEVVQSFLPAVSVNADGTVGVLYYDFRNDVTGDSELSTDVHLALFDAGLVFQEERRLTTSSFDMRQMVITGPRGYFPGDYVGLDTDGTDFVAAFTLANNLGLPVAFPQSPGLFVDTNNRQDIVFARETP